MPSNLEFLSPPVEQHRNGVAGQEMIRLGKSLADQHLAPAAGRQPAAGAQKQPVQFGRAKVRQRPHLAAGRLVHAGNIQRGLDRDARLDGRHAGDLRDLLRQRIGRAFELHEHFGKPVRLVIFPAGGFEGMDQAARHDHHRQAASHHQRHRDGLAFQPAQVAPEFAIEMGQHGRPSLRSKVQSQRVLHARPHRVTVLQPKARSVWSAVSLLPLSGVRDHRKRQQADRTPNASRLSCSGQSLPTCRRHGRKYAPWIHYQLSELAGARVSFRRRWWTRPSDK